MNNTQDNTGFGGAARLNNLIRDCERVLSFDPNNLTALRKVGYAKWILGEFDDVVQIADRILTINPADTDWLYSRAMAHMAEKRLELASADLAKALAICTDARMTTTILDAISTVRDLLGRHEQPTHAVIQIHTPVEESVKAG